MKKKTTTMRSLRSKASSRRARKNLENQRNLKMTKIMKRVKSIITSNLRDAAKMKKIQTNKIKMKKKMIVKALITLI